MIGKVYVNSEKLKEALLSRGAEVIVDCELKENEEFNYEIEIKLDKIKRTCDGLYIEVYRPNYE